MYAVWKIVKAMANHFEPTVDHYFNIITSLPFGHTLMQNSDDAGQGYGLGI